MASSIKIISLEANDIRFPTSEAGHGSDAIHTDPDYSCAYVTLNTSDPSLKGFGLTFTCGRGTEVVVAGIHALKHVIVGKSLDQIFKNCGQVWRELTSDSQVRWIGPEKGAIHLATGAIVNALWDLWAKVEKKPLWKLLADMEPELLVSTIDFRYIDDYLTKEEAISILKSRKPLMAQREKEVLERGVPVYTTSCGWVNYTDDERRRLCRQALKEGYTHFKSKVGVSLEDDRHRIDIIRQEVGPDKTIMVDANQVWSVPEAIEWMKKLADCKPYWIEEPTSPDDILGHAAVAKALNPLGIKVASGEMIANRVMFKQYFQSNAIQVCQIDSCRVGGTNEVLAIMLMATKARVPICPHAGGVGLCELVQHYAIYDYLLNGPEKDKVCEFVDHLHEHMVYPTVVEKAHYRAPLQPGFNTEIKSQSIGVYEFPNGTYWRSKAQRANSSMLSSDILWPIVPLKTISALS